MVIFLSSCNPIPIANIASETLENKIEEIFKANPKDLTPEKVHAAEQLYIALRDKNKDVLAEVVSADLKTNFDQNPELFDYYSPYIPYYEKLVQKNLVSLHQFKYLDNQHYLIAQYTYRYTQTTVYYEVTFNLKDADSKIIAVNLDSHVWVAPQS